MAIAAIIAQFGLPAVFFIRVEVFGMRHARSITRTVSRNDFIGVDVPQWRTRARNLDSTRLGELRILGALLLLLFLEDGLFARLLVLW